MSTTTTAREQELARALAARLQALRTLSHDERVARILSRSRLHLEPQ